MKTSGLSALNSFITFIAIPYLNHGLYIKEHYLTKIPGEQIIIFKALNGFSYKKEQKSSTLPTRTEQSWHK